MKVISGTLKGRIIKGFTIEGTRPTMDRVKESIFATIQNKVSGSIVLDLFAGSGNYGIEAISNYSRYVYFNDKNKEACQIILANLKELKIEDKGTILNLDYLKCLEKMQRENLKFDLIFLDPPYKLHILDNILEFISKNNLLNQNGLVIVEFMKQELKQEYSSLKLIKDKKYGEKQVYIYRKD